MMCDCHSYNWEIGFEKPVQFSYDGKTIEIDSCIAEVINHLWTNKIDTLGSCCGHNKESPSVVISTNENPAEVRKLLLEVDNRNWIIMRWELIKYHRRKKKTNEI